MNAPVAPKLKASSDQVIRNKLKEPGRYREGTVEGLYLQVSTTSKLWRLKYRLDGKEGLYAIGKFPDIPLAKAREIARWAREQVAAGVHPLAAKKGRERERRAKEANTFKSVAEDFLEFKSDLAVATLAGYRSALKVHLYPTVGDVPVTDIDFGHVKTVVHQLAHSPSMARYSLNMMKMVLDYAEQRELVDRNVATGRTSLLRRHKTKSYAALTTPAEMKEFLRRLDACAEHTDSVMQALRLLVLLPVRSVELANARWEEIDLGTAEWRYTVSKTGLPHIVPLPTQAVAILRSIQARCVPNKSGKGVSGWVFVSPKSPAKPISGSSILTRLLNDLGYERGTITVHGFRSSFRTIGHEILGLDPIVLELSLSHRMPGVLGAVYARVQLLDQRHAAAQRYADYLDELRALAEGQ
jgi:integrase